MSDTPINPIDALYDEDNNDAIVLMNEKGEEIPFEQIALIPQNDKTYAILKPLVQIEGVGENEGLVFSIETNSEGMEYLALIVEENIIDKVFDVYNTLIDEEEEDGE